jgi:hypothetical protein
MNYTIANSELKNELIMFDKFNFNNGSKWTLQIGLINFHSKETLKKKLSTESICDKCNITKIADLEHTKKLLKGEIVKWDEVTCDFMIHLYEGDKQVWWAQVILYEDSVALQTEDKVTKKLYGVKIPYSALDFIKYAR